MSKFKKYGASSLTAALVTAFSNKHAAGGFAVTTGDLVGSLESVDVEKMATVQGDFENTQNSIVDSVREAGAEIGDEVADNLVDDENPGLEAAAIIAMAAQQPKSYHDKVKSVSTAGLQVFGPMAAGSAGSTDHGFGLESYDVTNVTDYIQESIAYNLLAPRQDAFSEAFFRTVVLTPDQAMFKASIDRAMVYRGAVHTADGNYAKFDKSNVLEAFRNATILNNDATDLVPVYTNDSTNRSKFVANSDVPPYTTEVDGQEFQTAPLKIGAKLDLIGISGHPGLLQRGVLDQTDAVGPGASLAAVYVKITKDGESAVVKVPTRRLPGNQFLKTSEGGSRETHLRFRSKGISFNSKTRAVDGSEVPALAAISSAGLRASYEVILDGDLDLEKGNCTVRFGGASVARLVDESNGENLSKDHVSLNGVTVEVIGYDLDAARVNSNRRSVGLLLDSDRVEEIYTIDCLAPMTIIRPTNSKEGGSDIQTLVNTTHIRISNLAVTTLLNYAEHLEAFVSTAEHTTEIGGEIEGIGRYLVTPHYEEHEFDLKALVNSISSKDKLEDIRGFFVGVISEIAHRMVQYSGYSKALEVLSGNAGVKPKLVIGTDQVLSQFMMRSGDGRTFGIDMDADIVSSIDTRMFGEIFITFSVAGSGWHPLNFGNLFYVPEFVGKMPISRKGQHSDEVSVQPRFRHVCNLPIMARIKVLNLKEVLQSRVLLDVNTGESLNEAVEDDELDGIEGGGEGA